jgi:hypothetical protein
MATERERRREERRARFEKAVRERQKAAARKSPGARPRTPAKVTPFDLESFTELERLRSKAMLHSVLYALLASSALILAGRAAGIGGAGAIIALLLIGSLYWYLKIVWDVDMTKLGRPTSVVGVWFAYFITCIMVSFLLSNPPFHDELPPDIICCDFYEPSGNGSWLLANNSQVNHSAGSALVEAHVYDNAGVAGVTLSYQRAGLWTNGTVMGPSGNGAYRATIDNLTVGSYTVFVRATDISGLTAIGQGPSLQVV